MTKAAPEFDWDHIVNLTEALCSVGRENRVIPMLCRSGPFEPCFSRGGQLIRESLDEVDAGLTRRELLTRHLLVAVVLDQGPDAEGTRALLSDVIGRLYERGREVFHRPSVFFEEIGISIDEIQSAHARVKNERAEAWAATNKANAAKYSLYFAQSQRGIVSTQILDYALHRWGVPLCMSLLLDKDLEASAMESGQPLVNYLESHDSAELMTRQLKKHERYGLGSAIGDKACHLFAKFYVSALDLVALKREDKGWTGISYEVPFDSNAGRVLFRTGFLLEWASLEDYVNWDVIQKGKGKAGTDYIRVTNIRDKKTPRIPVGSELFGSYVELLSEYLKLGRRPRTVPIQRIPNLILYQMWDGETPYSVADFDDGLMHVGTKYCFNHANPNCEACPLRSVCMGCEADRDLVTKYTT